MYVYFGKKMIAMQEILCFGRLNELSIKTGIIIKSTKWGNLREKGYRNMTRKKLKSQLLSEMDIQKILVYH